MSIETLDNVLLYCGKNRSSPDVPLFQYMQPIADQMISDFLGWQVQQQEFTEWYPDRNLVRIRDELIDSAPYELIGGRAVQYGMLGLNAQTIQLRQLPVRDIVDLRENPSAWNVPNPPDFASVPPLQEGLDFLVDYREPDTTGTKISWTGEVYRLTGVWFISPWSGRTVQVTYTAGYTTAELTTGPWPAFAPAVRLASCMTIGKFVKEAQAQFGDSIGSIVTGTSGGAHTSESLAGYSIGYDSESQKNNLGWHMALPIAAQKILEPFSRMGKWV